jgi:hypothetical protein
LEYDFYSKKKKFSESLQMENVVWNIVSFTVLFCFMT